MLPRPIALRAADRHHFRFIVSPEDATQLADLRTFTRELMADVERDLGTRLDWVATDHWNTDNPHVHVLIRGKAEDGPDLVISRAYISCGFRDRAADRATMELGPRSELEIRTALEKEVDAERWTGLDRALRIQSLQNEAMFLLNQARNLASLPYSSLAQLQQSIGQTRQLLTQAQRIAYDVTSIDQAFSQRA